MKIDFGYQIPPEPVDFKRECRRQMMVNPPWARYMLQQGLWIGPTLWENNGWKFPLRYQVTYPNFMAAIAQNYDAWIAWIEDRIAWNEAVLKILDVLKIERK